MDNRTYRSKIDPLIGIMLVALIVGSLLLVLHELGQAAAHAPVTIGVGLLLGVALPLWLLLGTRYLLTSDALLIRSGPFRWRVCLAEIREVSPSRSLVSGPALSLDRLRIDYGRWRSVLISPRDREAFLAQLAELRAAQAAR